ncbi:hypothetical protein A2U01_0113718, partial [Trifolium medium]|nr:hypothetical protein [Trifolium medium]
QATESLPSTGDNWRRSRHHLAWRQLATLKNGARRQLATPHRTECSVAHRTECSVAV